MLYNQIKSEINKAKVRSKFRPKSQKLDQQIKSKINITKVSLTDQKSKVISTDQI